jgi:hypothetical protein
MSIQTLQHARLRFDTEEADEQQELDDSLDSTDIESLEPQQILQTSVTVSHYDGRSVPAAIFNRVKSVVAHPLGVDCSIINGPIAATPTHSFLQNCMGSAMSYMWSSVEESTKRAYKTAWDHFGEFCLQFGTNSTLTSVPPTWATFQLESDQRFSFKEAVIMSFMAHLRGNTRVTPLTINNYICGVKFFLFHSGVDVAFLKNNPTIIATKRGIANSYRCLTGNKSADSIRLPASVDFIHHLGLNDLSDRSDLRKHCAYASMCFAFCLLARSSEVLYSTTSSHWLKAEHVYFTVISNVGVQLIVLSRDVHQYSLANVLSVQTDIVSAKNDIDGQGHRSTFLKGVLSTSGSTAFDLCEEMYLWSVAGKPRKGDTFFASSLCGLGYEKGFRMTPGYVVKYLRSAASFYKFDPSRFAMHSFRIGGASALASAGIPNYTIQNMGRWKSLAFLRYIRLSTKAYETALEAMTNMGNFNNTSIKLWCSSALIS